ncbi:MAG: T9SS type A sorting domain-containing protein [Bacteroidales bacterium]|nr:T9SS type A sorting domain-containing protein [Bacteroidales bacterium]
MKMISLNHPIFFIVTMLFLGQHIYSQSYYSTRHLTRGADTAEIYLSCQWYADQNYITWNGIFHSTDNGQTLSVQRKTNFLVESGTIFGDSTAGALFQIPFIGQDTFGVSFDYGVSFEKKYFNDIYFETAGSMAGELYISGWGLYRGTNFGSNFTWQSAHDSLRLQEVGTLPGELFWTKGMGDNPIKLAYSNDYGQSFTLSNVTLPVIPIQMNVFNDCDIHRGTLPGELYFVIWKRYDSIMLFHTFNYGQTVTFQGYMFQTTDEVLYTAGRTPGTFYYVRREICGTPPCLHSCLWIYFSRDYGMTFTTYFHDLDSLYTGIARKEVLPEIKVFPNPANERITFRCGGPQPVGNTYIRIYNLLGKSVTEGILPKGQPEITMDVRNLAPGIYYYDILYNQHRQNGKIVISK